MLGIVKAVQHFRHYLIPNEFIIRTDHKALIYLIKNYKLKLRLTRWTLLLPEFKFKIEHIKGDSNFSDLLSRAFKINKIEIKKRNKKFIIPLIAEVEDILRKSHIEQVTLDIK